MSGDDKILHIISNETKNSIDQIQVVTPSVYASIFSGFASVHDTEIENEEEYATDILSKECSILSKMQDETSKNVQTLSKSAVKAISAIKDKDESTLNEVLKETQALRTEIEKLKESVYKDDLTHCYNRKWLHDEYLDAQTEDFNEDGTMAIIDLNYFKIINDTHGHVIGDKVLIFIANELKKSGQKVIRYGGDEFIIMFEKTIKATKALKILSNTREVIITKKLKAHKSLFITSFSIGVTEYKQGDKLNFVIENADKNMYIDKEAIKKRITGIEV